MMTLIATVWVFMVLSLIIGIFLGMAIERKRKEIPNLKHLINQIPIFMAKENAKRI